MPARAGQGQEVAEDSWVCDLSCFDLCDAECCRMSAERPFMRSERGGTEHGGRWQEATETLREANACRFQTANSTCLKVSSAQGIAWQAGTCGEDWLKACLLVAFAPGQIQSCAHDHDRQTRADIIKAALAALTVAPLRLPAP